MKHEIAEFLVRLVGDVLQAEANASLAKNAKSKPPSKRDIAILCGAFLVFFVVIGLYIYFQTR
jgi:hypothetical protein